VGSNPTPSANKSMTYLLLGCGGRSPDFAEGNARGNNLAASEVRACPIPLGYAVYRGVWVQTWVQDVDRPHPASVRKLGQSDF
jgi:hypothetical protein